MALQKCQYMYNVEDYSLICISMTTGSTKSVLFIELKKHVHETILTEDVLKCNQDAIKFYTGLPSYSIFKAVFDFVSAPLDKHHNSALSLFHQFLITLMKLHLNLADQDLAYRFGIANCIEPTVLSQLY